MCVVLARARHSDDDGVLLLQVLMLLDLSHNAFCVINAVLPSAPFLCLTRPVLLSILLAAAAAAAAGADAAGPVPQCT
jgi:hypothetical protein